ncbi:uncharacterized protein [Tenebrio molitor]|uniref:uncharacterized protein isoform X2 n=1 Tax=Tenebrio molitor TaxID=7067 RepID=UPI0036246D5F
MSQYNNFSVPVSDLPDQNDENWVQLLENLTVFISASANLVQSLKQTIEVSKLQPNNTSEEELLCACPKICENLYKSAGEITDIKVNETEKSNLPNNTETPTNGSNVENETSVFQNCKNMEMIGDAIYETALDTTNSSSNKTDNTKKVVCICKPGLSVSKGYLKETKSKSKSSKKQLAETFAKEKAEKLTKLKEDINVTQKNLVDMQEQVRQLERLYQDYDSLNTSEGQVNPAALYREIMKPQSVPYVNFCKPPTQCYFTNGERNGQWFSSLPRVFEQFQQKFPDFQGGTKIL